MTNYVLIYTGGTYPESEEENARVMAAWGIWYEKMGAAVVDGGNPFSPVSKHVSADGVSDELGGSAPATGYTIIAAGSLDEATAKVTDHPHISFGGQVSVYETFAMADPHNS